MKPKTERSESRSQTPITPELTEQISRRAYELFEARGHEHGHDREDWLQAETEILANLQTGSNIEEPEPAERHAATAA